MPKRVAIFWPGDYRAKPNEWALAQSREATDQLVAALRKLGRSPDVVEGYLTRPDQAITKLGPIDDPMVGVFVHWTYAPHTVDGVVGKDNPLLLASNFSGTWPGLVALLNTGASLESVGRSTRSASASTRSTRPGSSSVSGRSATPGSTTPSGSSRTGA